MVRNNVAGKTEELRGLGFDVHQMYIDPTAPNPLAEFEDAVSNNRFDVVFIVGGMRMLSDNMPLFERAVNLVHEKAPQAKIAFHSGPHDIANSVQRVPSDDIGEKSSGK